MMFSIRSIVLGTLFLCEAARRNIFVATAKQESSWKMPESEIRVSKENEEKKISENTEVGFLGPNPRESTDPLVDSS